MASWKESNDHVSQDLKYPHTLLALHTLQRHDQTRSLHQMLVNVLICDVIWVTRCCNVKLLLLHNLNHIFVIFVCWHHTTCWKQPILPSQWWNPASQCSVGCHSKWSNNRYCSNILGIQYLWNRTHELRYLLVIFYCTKIIYLYSSIYPHSKSVYQFANLPIVYQCDTLPLNQLPQG